RHSTRQALASRSWPPGYLRSRPPRRRRPTVPTGAASADASSLTPFLPQESNAREDSITAKAVAVQATIVMDGRAARVYGDACRPIRRGIPVPAPEERGGSCGNVVADSLR